MAIDSVQTTLTLGDWFGLDILSLPDYYCGAMSRKLIWRMGKPVGHWNTVDRRPDSNGVLWLQNYAGYNCHKFVYSFNHVDLALARAEKILAEWDVNPERPTWIC